LRRSSSRIGDEFSDQALNVRLGSPDSIVSVVDLAYDEGAFEEHGVRIDERVRIADAGSDGERTECAGPFEHRASLRAAPIGARGLRGLETEPR